MNMINNRPNILPQDGIALYFEKIVTDDEVKKGHFTVNVDDLQLDKGVYLTKLHNGEQSSVQKLIVR